MPNRNIRHGGHDTEDQPACLINLNGTTFSYCWQKSNTNKTHAFNANAISSDFSFLGSFSLIMRVSLNRPLLITPELPEHVLSLCRFDVTAAFLLQFTERLNERTALMVRIL